MFKKRKLISIMLTVSMMLTLFPFAAFAEEGAQAEAEQPQQEQTTPADVATQLPKAEDGVITLEKDVELSATHEFSQDVTLNLNGHNITAKDKRALWVKAGTLTITGKGLITSVKPENGSLKDASSVIRVGDEDSNSNAAELVLGKDVTVEAPATYGVTVFGKNNSLTADINGTIHSVVVPALAGNGGSGLTSTTITLGNTATVTADQAIAIYHPQAGTLSVNGATVQGTGGIEMKAGTLNVADGSKITATAKTTSHQANGNGTSTNGYAIVAVDTNGGYVGKVVVNVAGGTVTGPVDKVVDKAPAAEKEGSITVSGGTFTQDVTEFLADQKGQNADGSIGELGATNAVAKIGDVYYRSFSAAMTAAQDGATIEVLKDVTVPSAQYVIAKNITLKSTNKANINMTVSAVGAKPADNKAIDILKGAGLTLDGVVLTIRGNKNAAGNYDGTGIDINSSVDENVKGANLTLKNGAIINLTELERATIASAVGASPQNKAKNQSTLNMEPGTQLNMTKIDGNCANGGNWTLDNATVKIDGCGSHGLSAHEIIAKNNSDITVNNAGLVGVTAKDLIVESGSDVTVSNSGKNLPKALWNDPSKEYTNVVEMQDGGKFVVKDSIVTLANNKNKNEEVLNKIFVNDAKTDIQGSKIDAELVYAETDATKDQIHVEYIVDGKVYFAITDKVDNNGKVEFTEPADPTLSGYTFRYWDYPSNVTVSGKEVYLTPVKDQNTYTFVAKFSSNTPAVTEYSVTVKKTDNGSVSVSPKRAEAGDKVTINVDPDKGYVVDAVVVTDKDGDKITVTKKSATKYTFTMPKSRVDVKVTFKVEQTEPEQPSEMPFVDVVKDAWYYPAVEYVYNNELMNGTNGGLTFEPNVNLNRAMMAAVLYNMEGGPDCDKSGLFSDVADGMWYTDAVNWAASNNIVSGMPDGTYAPNQALTREQMASILYRYAEYKGIDTDARADLGKFTDGNTTSAWATDVVQWAVAEKLINGVGTELQPKGTASRAQVATVLMNYCENVAK